MINLKNEKNKSAVILSPERSEWVSRSHVTSVEPVVNDGAKTQCYSAKRDPRLIATQSPRMTEKALSLSGASSEKQKESSLILRKAKFQAIFEFVLSSASGGAGGGKYNRISAFVSMPVLLIRRSLEKFFKKNFRDDRFCFGFAKVLALAFLLSLNLSESWAVTCNFTPDPNNEGKYSLEVKGDSGGNVFSGCDNGFPDGISKWLYVSSKITSATLDKNITVIGGGAFSGASSLTSITIPDSVTIIGPSAFNGAKSLTSITIPDSVTSIGPQAFYNASSLESITIPDSVTSIGNEAFQYTKSLTSITIPDSVTSIGYTAFYGASSLKSIIIPDNIDTAKWDAGVFESFPAGIKNIFCQGDLNTCYEKLAKYFKNSDCPQNLKDAGKCTCSSYCISPSLVSEANKDQCGGKYIWNENSNPKCRHMDDDECTKSAKYYINSDGQCKSMPGSKTKCKNADFLWSESSCVKSCVSGFVEWHKECLSEYPFAKKRWTPAEANQWLHDGNDNFVVITFKK